MYLLIIIAVVAFLVYQYTKQQSGENQNRTNQRMWGEAAHYLNLKLYPPNEQSVFPSMSGKVADLYTEVWGDFDETGHGLVFCRVEFAQHLPFRLSIVKGGFERKSAGSSFEIRGISSPDISVTASDGKMLQSFLSSQNVNILKNCIGSSHSVKITESGLIAGVAGINDGVAFYSFIERIAAAAKNLSGGHTLSITPQGKPVLAPEEVVPEICVPEPEQKPEHTVVQNVTENRRPEPVPVPTPLAKPVPVSVPAPTPLAKPVPVSVPAPTPLAKSVSVKKEESAPELCSVDLSAEAFAKVLFSASFPGEKEKAYFNQQIGQSVQWSGTLKSVYPYSSDFVFGKGPGVKATFEICEVVSGYGMKVKIKATVSLGEETMSVLKGQTGKKFAFTGTLLKFEPFAKEILLEKGSLQG